MPLDMTNEDKLRIRGVSDALEREFKDLPSDRRDISKSKAEIAKCVTEWLTEHPKGLGRGQGGIGYCKFLWSPDKHYPVCKRKDACRCCMTKKAKQVEWDKSCDFCTEAWRLCLVTGSWKAVVFDIGGKKEKWYVEWSDNGEKISSRRGHLTLAIPTARA